MNPADLIHSHSAVCVRQNESPMEMCVPQWHAYWNFSRSGSHKKFQHEKRFVRVKGTANHWQIAIISSCDLAVDLRAGIVQSRDARSIIHGSKILVFKQLLRVLESQFPMDFSHLDSWYASQNLKPLPRSAAVHNILLLRNENWQTNSEPQVSDSKTFIKPVSDTRNYQRRRGWRHGRLNDDDASSGWWIKPQQSKVIVPPRVILKLFSTPNFFRFHWR